jgi:hypothetical protein
MKYIIILIIIVVLFFVITQENFDVSANLNLLTNSEIRFDNALKLPISPDPVEDNETPNLVLFDKKINLPILQKLKAINNILERIKDISITESSSNVITFNPALLPVKEFTPDDNKLSMINSILIDLLKFYSGGQYILNVMNIDNEFGVETDDQYKIKYSLYGEIDNIDMRIIVELIIIKSSTTQTDLNIVFTELRIDNPNIYITPNNNLDKYESINDYNKSLK